MKPSLLPSFLIAVIFSLISVVTNVPGYTVHVLPLFNFTIPFSDSPVVTITSYVSLPYNSKFIPYLGCGSHLVSCRSYKFFLTSLLSFERVTSFLVFTDFIFSSCSLPIRLGLKRASVVLYGWQAGNSKIAIGKTEIKEAKHC